MEKEEKKKTVEEMSCTVFLTNGQQVPLVGYKKKDTTDFVFLGKDGRFNRFIRSAVSCLIRDTEETPQLHDLTKTKKQTIKMSFPSGVNLAFNGWNIPGEPDKFLSEQNDLIEVWEDPIYISHGTFIEPAKPEPTKLEVVKDGKERTLH